MSKQFNRRELMRGMIGGAVALAIAPGAFAQFGPAPGIISLRANENPYGPSEKALKAAAEALHKGAYYPGEIRNMLLDTLVERNGMTRDNMILSSGSNEGLQAAMVAYGKRGKVVLPELTYSDHLGYSKRMGVDMVRVPLKQDMSIDLDGMAAAVDESVSMVYVCNPNNPTGMTLDGDTLRAFCRKVSKKALVLVDEAYNELTDDPEYTSMLDLVREGENVLVMRTFSKIFGMAGLRVGYGMAQPDVAKLVSGHVMAWANGVGMAAAHASYTDDEFIQFSRKKIIEGRAMVNATFRKNGIEPLPSQTNFIYADIGRDATEFQQKMVERNIQIRGTYQTFTNYSRVSMGKLEELEVFDRVFTEVYNA
ncbi:MAG: pyridoxal phosphate-dependent aminotransferase [Woeseiaceae bacterium]